MPDRYAVIVENDITQWADETGECYHFPNRYTRLLPRGARLLALFLPILINLGLAKATAAEITVEEWRGHKALRLSGVIDAGTADSFRQMIKASPPSPHGLPVLLLDSGGGSVEEALSVSAIMDAHPTHTVIPAGARCASACASIIFIAGQNRTVEEGGGFGQHSCSIAGKPDEACNEEIALHAVRHGVSHGSVAAFVTYVPPHEILWFSREDADGWGLTRYPGEAESGFEKSEPRVLNIITGKMPTAQAAWRIDFREDGYQAFVRTVSDAEAEMEIRMFCVEALRGRLFLSMLLHGSKAAVDDAVIGVGARVGDARWEDLNPVIWQAGPDITEVITEIPTDRIKGLLTRDDYLRFGMALREPYGPIIGQTFTASSRSVLKFAANNCTSGEYPERRAPIR